MVRLSGGTWEDIARLIDPEFLKFIAEKYGISGIELEDLKDDIAQISYGICGGYYLQLNPKIDRVKMAGYLSERTGLKIQPDEIYYYAVFHECGHIYDKKSPYSAGALVARPFFLNQVYPGTGKLMTWEQIRLDRIEAERMADEFAIREFKQWRKKRQELIIN